MKKYIADNGFKLHIDDYTHVTPNRRRLQIDVVISNISVIGLHTFNAHSLIDIQLIEEKVNKTTTIIRNRIKDVENFRKKIIEYNYETRDLNERYNKLLVVLFPKKEIMFWNS